MSDPGLRLGQLAATILRRGKEVLDIHVKKSRRKVKILRTKRALSRPRK